MRMLCWCLVHLLFLPCLKAELGELYRALPQWYSVGATAPMPRFSGPAYLAVVVELQQESPERIIGTLREWAAGPEGGKVIPLCRMLFEAREGGGFRAPRLGWGGACPREDRADWPLEPIALSDSIPFLVCPRYGVVEQAESGAEYLRYCIENCQLTKRRYRLVGEAELADALKGLLAQVGGSRKGTWALYFKQQISLLSK